MKFRFLRASISPNAMRTSTVIEGMLLEMSWPGVPFVMATLAFRYSLSLLACTWEHQYHGFGRSRRAHSQPELAEENIRLLFWLIMN